MEVVPGTGVSGRALLGALIAAGVLDQPPCFDRAHPNGECGADERLDLPLLYWPPLHAGAADLVLDRQIGQQGQCQHFMANTGDGLTPPDPRFGVPSALVTEAYQRCVRIAGAVFDLILRDPQLARWRLAGTYVLIHALQDSFSAAHVNRDPHLQIVHLLSWKLIDWPRYAWHGHLQFPVPTHHMITDPRDADFLRRGRAQPRRPRLRGLSQPVRVSRGVPDRTREGGRRHGGRPPGRDLQGTRRRDRGGTAGVAVLVVGGRGRRVAGIHAGPSGERGRAGGASGHARQPAAPLRRVRRRAGDRRRSHPGGRSVGRQAVLRA